MVSEQESDLQYGGQIVPLVRDVELALKYAPEKAFQVVGAVALEAVPHAFFMSVCLVSSKYCYLPPCLDCNQSILKWQLFLFLKQADLLKSVSKLDILNFVPLRCTELSLGQSPDCRIEECMQDTWLVAPEKGNDSAQAGISALASALQEANLGLLVRFVPRLNGEITVGLMTPLSHEPDRPEAFVMNSLPYEADIRPAAFHSFLRHPELLPSVQQTAAMDQLIDALMLDDGKSQHLSEALLN